MNPSDFKPMLAKDAAFDNEGKLKAGFPQIVQPKLDGIRASVVGGKLLTRTLKEVPNREVFEALSRPEFEGLDGELIVGEPTADDCYRKTASFCMSGSKTGEAWTYWVFDVWNTAMEVYVDRLRRVLDLARAHDRIVPLLYHAARDADDLEAYEAQKVAQDGYEGVILRTPRGPYKFGRSGKSGPLLKLKRFIDFEATIIGVYEEMHNANEAVTNALGRTERSSHKAGKVGKGTLGGFYLRAINGPAEGVEFKCGTGFDAAQRTYLWKDWVHGDTEPGEGVVGRVVKVKSFPVGVKDKPRHPVFLGFRDMEFDG